ncbi:hypothetical protein JL720_3408 [Aureococcus anophagefferens]|nr:hypothetical protein JL720_3408 [Aureococcus anophagefferens]
MDVVTTGSSSELTGTLSVGVDCIDFQLAAGFCQEADSASLCAEHSTVTRTLDPTTLVEACPGSAVQDENGIITLTLGVTIGVAMSSSTAGIDTQTVSESLDLGVAAHRVALDSSPTAPCDIYSASSSATMDANSRVCLMLNTTDEDSESYVAFLKDATVRNLDSGLEYALVSNRKFGQSAPGYKYAGAWLNDAHADLAELTKAYHDYFTFFLPPGLRPDEGAAANLEVQMVVEYHHVDTGARKLRRATRELQAAANEDSAVLQLGASNPSLAEEGTAGVDLKLELDGLPMDDYLASGDVELTGVAASADGIFVQIHVSGIDDAGALGLGRRRGVASGNFYFRLASNGLVVNTVVLAGDVVAYEEAAAISVVDLEVESAIAFENLGVSAFNDGAAPTLRDAGADYAETYLSEFVAGVAEAADDGLFVQVLQQGGQVFADVAVDVEATSAVLEATTVAAEERSEASSSSDDGTESASADVPMFIGIAGVVVLAVGLAALYKARKTNAAVPPVKGSSPRNATMPARVAPEAADLASVVQTVVATSRWRRAVRGCTELDTEGLGGEVGLRRRLVGLAAAVTLAIFVGEQFVWVTPSGKPIGLKWLIYLGTWAVVYTLAYEAVAYAAARSVARDEARGVDLSDDSKDLARCAVLMRALINPLGLVGCASWLVFVKDSDEGEMRRAWLWEIISFVKHVGPEAAFLLDVHVRPRPMLHVADAALGLVVPATYATFLVAYYYAGGTNYENERIEDIEGDILDGFRSTPKDDILNGWDATSPQPAEEAKARTTPAARRPAPPPRTTPRHRPTTPRHRRTTRRHRPTTPGTAAAAARRADAARRRRRRLRRRHAARRPAPPIIR